MEKWELARYLIDAKKNIDSIMYIAEVFSELEHLPIRRIVTSCRQSFYINCCVVLDNAYSGRGKKKQLCNMDPIAEKIYYERDKNFAHKDYDYEAPKFSDISEMFDVMQKQIAHVKEISSSVLPSNLTLDFVPHDPVLFRLVNGVTKQLEDEIEEIKYSHFEEMDVIEYGTYPILNDTEDIRSVPPEERRNFAVQIVNGINRYEGIQNRQDACIRFNVLHNKNIWCEMNMNVLRLMKKLEDMEIVDKFGIPFIPDKNNPEDMKKMQAFLEMELDVID